MDHALLEKARAIAPWLEEIFFTLHRRPELGGEERETAALIRRTLEKLGIRTVPLAETGTMGLLRGGAEGPCLAFRADMDALPIREETGLPWASQVPGVMHACGHDFHTTALLGAARLLSEARETLPGTVKFLFQPDEEGEGGAARMIAQGCLEDPAVEAAFCVHVDSALPAGTAAVGEGTVCAASDPFSLRLRGRGTHGAKPHLGDDVICAGAQIVTALQTVASRRTDPAEPVVVTVGTFHAGQAGNALPEEAALTGILRTMGGQARERVRAEVRAIVSGVSSAMGVEADLQIVESYPACRNAPALAALLRRAAGEILGADRVLPLSAPSMGADDFGCFSGAVPGCYWSIGVGSGEKGVCWPNHSPRFAADPAALPLAAAIHARTVLDYLNMRRTKA